MRTHVCDRQKRENEATAEVEDKVRKLWVFWWSSAQLAITKAIPFPQFSPSLSYFSCTLLFAIQNITREVPLIWSLLQKVLVIYLSSGNVHKGKKNLYEVKILQVVRNCQLWCACAPTRTFPTTLLRFRFLKVCHTTFPFENKF